MKYLLLILALSLPSCLRDETISGQTTPSDVFILQAIGDLPVASRITLTFPKQGQIAGMAPCNSYSATQEAPLPWFDAGPIAATKRACPDLELESRYFTALAAATLIERQGNTLLLTGEDLTLQFTLE